MRNNSAGISRCAVERGDVMFNHLNSTPMVTTRKQDALQAESKEPHSEDETQLDGEEATEDQNADDDSEPPRKKVKIETPEEEIVRKDADSPREPGTTERGHIYFFFRPRVETDAPSMLLVPRPPKFSAEDDTQKSDDNSDEMELLTQGADAVPAAEPLDMSGKHYRLITNFWATVTAVGDDLDALENRMGEQTYNTKTRGTRHDPPAHDFGPVQIALGIYRTGAFVLQVKNPEASGALSTKDVVYPPAIMDGVFGKGTRGREPTGLRFAPCAKPQMLDYVGVELLLVAVRGGETGLEESLGEGRGEALTEAAEMDEVLSVEEIFRELWGGDEGQILPEVLNGEWI
ncbi:hypothetical protein B0H14DRAFT_3116656 [Mycena olivaceomarginata]|nr:hypothetical protein B0H14DRAFT_3116656 [Mycena olivaceomarginata]